MFEKMTPAMSAQRSIMWWAALRAERQGRCRKGVRLTPPSSVTRQHRTANDPLNVDF